MVACPLLYLCGCVTLVHALVASKGPCARYCRIHVVKLVPVMTSVYYPPLFPPTSSVRMKPFNRIEKLIIPVFAYTYSHFSLVCCIMSMQKPLFHFLIKRKGSSSQFSKSCKFRGQLVGKLNECCYGHSECSSHKDVPSCHKHRNNIFILELHYTWSYTWEICSMKQKYSLNCAVTICTIRGHYSIVLIFWYYLKWTSNFFLMA